MDVVELSVEGARYAVPLERVVEVLPRLWLTPLPGAPPHVAGAFAYRGRAAVALDLRSRLGHPPRKERLTDHFVVTRGDARPIAVIVDGVLGVRALDAADVRPAPMPSSVVAGVVALHDGLLLLDDLEALLSAEQVDATERALSSVDLERVGPPR